MAELADGHAPLRERRTDALMAAGVRDRGPGHAPTSASTSMVEADAVLRPFTFLEGRTVVRAGASVGPFARLVDTRGRARRPGPRPLPPARVRGGGRGAAVGPFAHIRPESRDRGRGQGGQLRRAEEDAPRATAPRRRTSPTSATPPSGPASTSAPAPSPATTTARTSTRRASRPGPSSGSDTHPRGAGHDRRGRLRRRRAAPSPRTCPPDALALGRARQVIEAGLGDRRRAGRTKQARRAGLAGARSH